MLAIAGGAVAYFTTTSSGTGTAQVGTSSALTISSASTASNLYPGGTARPIAFSIDNTSDGHQYVGKVSATVTAVYDSTNTTEIDENGTNACATSNFTTGAASSDVGDIAGGTTYNSAASAEPTVSMTNNGNQNGCENAVVHLSLSSS
ncbi:MAG TPA: hypothetical protein VMP89_17265 [Solirubrobacteraceae bacterium]|nr:hypothetical protein [Solirubrobacteraceae bacterium]